MMCLPSGLSSPCNGDPSVCCSQMCVQIIAADGQTCCNPNGAQCDLTNPGACCSGACFNDAPPAPPHCGSLLP
jgi:hypothetical protein